MQAQDLGQVQPAPLKLHVILCLGLVSLAIYLSGVFLWLTPLPVLYAYSYGAKHKAWLGILLPVSLLAFVYVVLWPYVVTHYGIEQAAKVFFWIPGMSLGSGQLTWDLAIFGIAYYLFFAMMGVLLGEFESRPYSITRLMAQSSAVLVLALLLWLALYTLGSWSAFVTGLQDYFTQVLAEVIKMQAGNEEMQVQWAFLQNRLPEIAYYSVRLLPAMIFNLILFVLWLNVVVAKKIFTAGKGMFCHLGSLQQWQLPFGGVWLTIAFAFLWMLDAYWLKLGFIKLIAINIFLVLALIYFFQGMAIVAFYLNRWALSPVLRLVLYSLLILFFQPLSFLLVAFGFFDSWFDFRKLLPKPT